MQNQKVIKLFNRILKTENGTDIQVRVSQSLKEEIEMILKVGRDQMQQRAF